MLGSDLARVPLMVSLPVLHAAGLLSFPVLLVLVTAFGCFGAPYFASQRVILPELIGNDQQLISQANSLARGSDADGVAARPAARGRADRGARRGERPLHRRGDVRVLVPRRVAVRAGAKARGRAGGVGRGARGVGSCSTTRSMGPLASVVVLLNALGADAGAALPVLAFERYGDAKTPAGCSRPSVSAA